MVSSDESYLPLPSETGEYGRIDTATLRRKRTKVFALASVASVVLLGLVVIVLKSPFIETCRNLVVPEVIYTNPPEREYVPRGFGEGVSEKSSRVGFKTLSAGSPERTNKMLLWQRSAYHFQPEENWMNDPNGVMYYKGWYHLFYQYNADSAVWGNITWGHSVSRDMIHWLHLPIAMFPDKWYDENGVWSGSATVLPDGKVIMLYTGSSFASAQLQNVAVPTNISDPLLIDWMKFESNPIIAPPPGIGITDFRDPTTAWYFPGDSSWRIVIGSKDSNKSGVSITYKTEDFLYYDLLPGSMHSVAGTGMWECIDLYPISTDKTVGLDTSTMSGSGVKHVMKVSLDDDRHDYYAIGSYDLEANTWTPDDPNIDVGIGLRLDYGVVYASKSFYDPVKKRRVLWGWVPESDSESADVLKGWASLQTIPRTVRFDQKTKTNLLQWPVEELEQLRGRNTEFSNVDLPAGSMVQLNIKTANTAELDITAEFEIIDQQTASPDDVVVGRYDCNTGGGASGRGALGPFGLLLLADEGLSEQTAVYFYLETLPNGNINTFICQDGKRSSAANDVIKSIYGSTVPVLDGEKLTLRILVDHSIVETYAQEGRTCITSRVYPTKAISEAKIYLFNNSTDTRVTATTVKIWEMNSAFNRPYNFENTTGNEF